ncbi:MAG: efflux RND transporter permease subunit [Alphaproteobacteria bacterium]
MNDLYVSYARWVIRWRWIVLPVVLGLALWGAAGNQYRAFSNDYRVFFDAQNPDLLAHEMMERTYVAADVISFVLKPQDGTDMFTPAHLESIQELTEMAWQIPYVVRVDSLSNYQHTRAEEDDLLVDDLIPEGTDLTPERIAEIRRIAMAEPQLFRRAISEDGTATSVVATLEVPEEGVNMQEVIVPKVDEITADFREAHPDIRLSTTGQLMMSLAFFRVTQSDLATLFPLMVLILAVSMALLLRSFIASGVAIITVLLSVLTAMGVWFYLGVKLTPASGSVAVIIVTVAVADAIHLLVTMGKEMGAGKSRHDAIVESVRINMEPVALTSLTTAIGFLSLNFSDAPPFRDLGNISATGAVFAWIFSVLLLPALVAVLPMRPKIGKGFEQAALFGLVERIVKKPKLVLLGVFGVAVVLGSSIPTVAINDRFVEFLSRDISFRQDADYISENLPGIYDVAFSLSSGEEGGIADPEYLMHLDRFSTWLQEQPEIVHVSQFGTVMKRLNRSMNGDDDAYYRLPESRELAAQYLLLYEMSLPYGLDLNNQINVPKSATRVMATMDNITSTQMKQVKWRAEAWMEENLPAEMFGAGSGTTIIFAFLTQRNLSSMMIGTAIAIVLISLCLVAALRSFKLGMLSLIPNFLPPVIAFGIWTTLVGEIGLYAAMVTATSLGLIVDFTVHFLSKYLRARREQGAGVEAAIHYAFQTVGSALWISAAVLIVGFSVLAWSDFAINANLGIFVALTVAVALVVDFLVLPALLLLADKDKQPASQTKVAPAQ